MFRLSAAALSLVVMTAVLVSGSGQAAPPEGADPNSQIGQWFQSLKQPGSGISCCSIADCRPVEYRLVSDGYEALLDKDWVRIPDQAILHGHSNPTARGILCRAPVSGTILCFVPASDA